MWTIYESVAEVLRTPYWNWKSVCTHSGTERLWQKMTFCRCLENVFLFMYNVALGSGICIQSWFQGWAPGNLTSKEALSGTIFSSSKQETSQILYLKNYPCNCLCYVSLFLNARSPILSHIKYSLKYCETLMQYAQLTLWQGLCYMIALLTVLLCTPGFVSIVPKCSFQTRLACSKKSELWRLFSECKAGKGRKTTKTKETEWFPLHLVCSFCLRVHSVLHGISQSSLFLAADTEALAP